MTVGIYGIIHIPSGRMYIGASSRIEDRWADHRGQLKRHAHTCAALQAAWDQDGPSSFSWHVLEICRTDKLASREWHHIDATPHAFNPPAPSGSGRGGSRAGAGRPCLENERMEKISVRLNLEQRKKADQLGDGDAAAGVRRAIDQASLQ